MSKIKKVLIVFSMVCIIITLAGCADSDNKKLEKLKDEKAQEQIETTRSQEQMAYDRGYSDAIAGRGEFPTSYCQDYYYAGYDDGLKAFIGSQYR